MKLPDVCSNSVSCDVILVYHADVKSDVIPAFTSLCDILQLFFSEKRFEDPDHSYKRLDLTYKWQMRLFEKSAKMPLPWMDRMTWFWKEMLKEICIAETEAF